jgi:hypothetical protein
MRRAVGSVAAMVVVWLALDPRPARACSPAHALPFRADAEARASDRAPPGKARVSWVAVHVPTKGSACPWAVWTLVPWAKDDTTPAADLGWMVEVQRGTLAVPRDPVKALHGELFWSWPVGDDDTATVDAVIVVRAVDRAGNVGPPSDPVPVRHGPERDESGVARPAPRPLPTSREGLEEACASPEPGWAGDPCARRADLALAEGDLRGARSSYQEACVRSGGLSSTCDMVALLDRESSDPVNRVELAVEYRQLCRDDWQDPCLHAHAILDEHRAELRRRAQRRIGGVVAAVLLVVGAAGFTVQRSLRRRRLSRGPAR